MRFRKLGSSDLEVSEISLGSWLTYSGGVEAEQSRACTDAAFDAGINFFDTANVYGQGAAESAWGRFSPAAPATPTCWPPRCAARCPTPTRDFPVQQIAKQIDASLAPAADRLRRPVPGPQVRLDVPIEDTIEALQKVVESGKARYLGIQRVDARTDPRRHRDRWAGPLRLLPAPVLDAVAGARGRGVPAVRGQRHLPDRLVSVGAGRSDGQVHSLASRCPLDSRFANEAMNSAMDIVYSDPALEAVQRLVAIADGAGIRVADLALAWVLRRPEVASAIMGASRPEQVHANAAASDIEAHRRHPGGRRHSAR